MCFCHTNAKQWNSGAFLLHFSISGHSLILALFFNNNSQLQSGEWGSHDVLSPCVRVYVHVSLVTQTVKNLPAMQETQVQSPSQADPPEGNSNPLQCSCLENPMDRGAWRATVHRAAKSWT